MAAFDWTKQQKSCLPPNTVVETGRVVATGISSQTFKVATKIKKVRSGHGIMVTDGLPALVTIGEVTNGQVTFTRVGSITTSADEVDYVIYGVY